MTAEAVGGVWTYAVDLIEALPDDVDVVLASMGPPPTPVQRSQIRRLERVRFRECPFPLEWMDEPWEDVARADEWLLELNAGVDLVHLNGFGDAVLPFEAPVLVVGRSCLLSWHEAVRGTPAGEPWARYATAVERGLRAADAVVTPTAAMLHELERLYDICGERVVIPNGRSRTGLSPLPKEDVVLGVRCARDEAKNLSALERVAPRVPWPVVVVGDGGKLGRVGEQELGLLYGRAAIFAEPARYEPFGLTAVEAALCGCALVLGGVESLLEVWGDAAVYVDPDDDADLERVLRRLIANPALRERLGREARRRALAYSPERMAAAYGALYKRLVRGAPRVLGQTSEQRLVAH